MLLHDTFMNFVTTKILYTGKVTLAHVETPGNLFKRPVFVGAEAH